MKLDVTKWKPFLLGDLFFVNYGVNLELNACEEATTKSSSNINFVSRTGDNNGVSARVVIIEDIVPQKEGLISIAGGGSVLSTFLQNEPFYSGRDLYTLECKEKISNETKLFLITVIEQNKYKYSYGRQANKTLPYIELLLPIKYNKDNTAVIDNTHNFSKDGYVPDWDYMHEYIKTLHFKPLKTKNHKSTNTQLDIDSWEEFTFADIFVLKGGFYNKKPEHSQEGKVAFLGSTENNNGVTEFYSLEDIKNWNKTGDPDNTLDNKIYEGNCIAVTVNGSVCNAFYQADEFTCSHDITAFYLKKHTLNSHLALFLCTVIMQDKYRWSYGRKPHDVKKFTKSNFKLPILKDCNGLPVVDSEKTYSEKGYIPDWDFMENYIKSLPYGDRI